MDISGVRQNDISHNIIKTRLNSQGVEIEKTKAGQLKGDADRAAQANDPTYCGSCYGATPPENGCCNTCEEVRQAYIRKGWSFSDPNGIEQCIEEHWTEKMEQQNAEGCRISGKVKVNKVIGNLQFSHGSTFMRQGMSIQELVPYLKDSSSHHDFGHVIHKFAFGADLTPEQEAANEKKELETRARLDIYDPLTNVAAHSTDEEDSTNYMFQYFVKVVSTSFVYLNGAEIPSHQYSVTRYERDLRTGNLPTRDDHGHVTTHHTNPIPGLFIK